MEVEHMPRRTLNEARQVAEAESVLRLRFLLRNQNFRQDMMQVRAAGHQSEVIHGEGKPGEPLPTPNKYDDFVRKWGLVWFPSDLLWSSNGQSLPRSLPDEEAPNVLFRSPVRPPVIAEDPAQRYYDDHQGEKEHPYIRPGTRLSIDVDLSYPRDVVEALIGDELRNAYEKRERHQEKGFLPRPHERQRLDKMDFQLQVYDLAHAGLTFDEIARGRGLRTSVVHYAFVAAQLKIGTPRPRKIRHVTIHTAFNVNRHVLECPTCKSVQKADGSWDSYCAVMQDYATYRMCPEYVSIDDRKESGDPKDVDTRTLRSSPYDDSEMSYEELYDRDTYGDDDDGSGGTDRSQARMDDDDDDDELD
jgi:hypothetical protein